MPASPALATISFRLRCTSMILVSADTVDSSSAVSSALAMTVPHSWASTDSKKMSWLDRGWLPRSTRKTGSPASWEVSGKAQPRPSILQVELARLGESGQRVADSVRGALEVLPGAVRVPGHDLLARHDRRDGRGDQPDELAG